MSRPTKYNPAFIEVTRRLRQRGMPGTAIAEALGVSRRTFFRWRAKHKDFGKAAKALWHGRYYGRFDTHAREFR